MQLVLELDDVTVHLGAPDDTGRLSVVVSGPPGATAASHGHRLGDVLVGLRLGRPGPDGDALLNPEALRFLAAGQVGEDWEERFGAMAAYAASQGWVGDDGALQAHVVWPPA